MTRRKFQFDRLGVEEQRALALQMSAVAEQSG